MSRIEISNVLPPKSYTAIFLFIFLSAENASAEAVGSLIIRRHSRPAIVAASFILCLCESEKYAGHVITAWVIFSPKYASASFLILARILAEISSGEYSLSLILILQSPFGASTTLYGSVLI